MDLFAAAVDQVFIRERTGREDSTEKAREEGKAGRKEEVKEGMKEERRKREKTAAQRRYPGVKTKERSEGSRKKM